jgi:CubicO group peptidase (beta-lactamase class C family)
MKKITIIILNIFLIISCSNHKQIDKKVNKEFIVENNKSKRLDSLFSELYKNQKFNGNILVAENDTIIFKRSYGYADINSQTKLNTETVFELASVTKQFTAMGIYLLSKKGKLSLKDTISKYIPELNEYKGITIQNLLIHTGGLPDYMYLTEKYWDKTKIATNDDILKLFKEKKPKVLFKPSEKWQYSNTGYLILASIIERVSNKDYGEYLQENIFKPLRMKSTFVYRRWYQPKEIENYANGYIYSDSLKKLISPDKLGKDFYVVYLDGIVGDGMVNSNLTDLYKWDKAIFSDQFINKEDRKLIFSSYKTNNDKETDYGFGWMIDNPKQYGQIVNHSGGWGGYVSWNEIHIDNEKVVIILQNIDIDKTTIPIKNTRKILYNKPIEKPISLDANILKKYSGTYLKENEKEAKVIYENNKLYIALNPAVNLELIPISKTKFIVDGFSPEVTYDFFLDNKGNVIKFRVVQEATGLDKECKRKSK